MCESEKWKWSRSVVSDASQPRGLQPTRLLRPWDFPGKGTGVGCHHLLRLPLLPVLKGLVWWFQNPVCMEREGKWKSFSCVWLLATPWTVNSPGQNTEEGALSLLQWIFLIQELNQGLLHCRWILYQLRYQGSPCMERELWSKTREHLENQKMPQPHPEL